MPTPTTNPTAPCEHLWYPQAKQQDYCVRCQRLKQAVEAEEQAELQALCVVPTGVQITATA